MQMDAVGMKQNGRIIIIILIVIKPPRIARCSGTRPGMSVQHMVPSLLVEAFPSNPQPLWTWELPNLPHYMTHAHVCGALCVSGLQLKCQNLRQYEPI